MEQLRSHGKYKNRGIWAKPYISLLLLLCGTIASGTRHSTELDSQFQLLAKRDITAQNNDNQNHRPVFVNCSNYAPEVNEEALVGTVVFQVRAEDPDPPENGGTITYSFWTLPNERLKFEINNITGLISTTWIFDRDEPVREKIAYLTVLATDNGKPQYDDVCTFKVTIKDVNDNNPVFEKVTYMESVPKDLLTSREVMRVSAIDIDDNDNGLVVYSLFPKRLDDVNYFYIDNRSGIIYLNKTIDRNPGYTFRMTAKAQDLGKNPQTSLIDVDIRVVESHIKSPSFLTKPQEPIKLQENFSDFSASIVKLEAVSNVDSQNLIFELITGPTEQTNKGNTFRLESNENVADIKLSKPFDYERNTEYNLTVRVKNIYGAAVETVINIKILDVNDNIPVIREMKKGSVLENEAAGGFVIQVQAIDDDATSAHNQVTYELENFKDVFAIDSNTGVVTTLTTFDREKKDTYSVMVTAIDNSPSAIFKRGEPNKSKQGFHIEIIDKNDNPPNFTKTIYTAILTHEDANIDALVTKVQALDADTTSQVTYSIVAGNTNENFYIEDKTGEIYVKKALDHENTSEYNLTVKAFDGLFNDTAQVKIRTSVSPRV